MDCAAYVAVCSDVCFGGPVMIFVLLFILGIFIVFAIASSISWNSMLAYEPTKIKDIENLEIKDKGIILTIEETAAFGRKREVRLFANESSLKYKYSAFGIMNSKQYEEFSIVETGEIYSVSNNEQKEYVQKINDLLIQIKNKQLIDDSIALHYENLVKTVDDDLTNKIESLTKQKESIDSKRKIIKARVQDPSLSNLTNAELLQEIQIALKEKQL